MSLSLTSRGCLIMAPRRTPVCSTKSTVPVLTRMGIGTTSPAWYNWPGLLSTANLMLYDSQQKCLT